MNASRTTAVVAVTLLLAVPAQAQEQAESKTPARSGSAQALQPTSVTRIKVIETPIIRLELLPKHRGVQTPSPPELRRGLRTRKSIYDLTNRSAV